MSTLKKITGKLLALGVSLHSQAISRHVRSFAIKAEAAQQRTEQARTDAELAKRAFGNALDAEMDAHADHEAAKRAAEVELASLPSVRGYSRAAPPFGSKPTVIDKRKQ